jgi:PPOX class probable FMN-dependent enzyme
MYRPKAPITTAAEVKAIPGPIHPSQIAKVIDHIDEHCAKWIERCPFIVISSINAAGSMDISPKGDPAGFVKVLDKHTLAIPDRLGNQRADTFLNVLENPSVGVIFIVPNRREVVRMSGTASLVRDSDLLEQMALNGKTPRIAMLVYVREAFFHCGKSMIRSGRPSNERRRRVDQLQRLVGVFAVAGRAERNTASVLSEEARSPCVVAALPVALPTIVHSAWLAIGAPGGEPGKTSFSRPRARRTGLLRPTQRYAV